MPPPIVYWIKFADGPNKFFRPPERMQFANLDELWHTLRELFLREGLLIEWMIRE